MAFRSDYEQREALNGLAGPSMQRQGASGTNGWTKPATPIEVPVNRPNIRDARSITSGPFGGNRFRDDLSPKTQNPVAQRTYLQGDKTFGAPPPKRRKFVDEPPPITTGPRQKKQHRQPHVITAPDNVEIINVDEVQEGLGQPVNAVASSSTRPPPDLPVHRLQRHSFDSVIAQTFKDVNEMKASSSHHKTAASSTGPKTAWLEGHLNGNGQKGSRLESVDDIEDFSEEPDEPIHGSKLPGRVRTLAKAYENKSVTDEMMTQTIRSGPPSLDLRKFPISKKTDAMKLKSRAIPMNNASTVNLEPPGPKRTGKMPKANGPKLSLPAKVIFAEGRKFENLIFEYDIQNEEAEIVEDPVRTSDYIGSKNKKISLEGIRHMTSSQSPFLVVLDFESSRSECPPLCVLFDIQDQHHRRDFVTLIKSMKRKDVNNEIVLKGDSVWETIERSFSMLSRDRRQTRSNNQPRSSIGGKQTTLDSAMKKPWHRVESSSPDPLLYPPSDNEVLEIPNRTASDLARQRRKSMRGKAKATALGERPVSTVPQRRSARQAEYDIVEAPDVLSPIDNPEEIVLVYPWGSTGAVNLNRGDLGRLRPSQFLNDNLIEFGLKLWMTRLEKDNPELAKDVHVFSPFFYGKLKAGDGYQNVRRWTSKVDIFKKKYLIVPINENYHWYLAIVYRPEYILLEPRLIDSPATRTRARQTSPFLAINSTQESVAPETTANKPDALKPEAEAEANANLQSRSVSDAETIDTSMEDAQEIEDDLVALSQRSLEIKDSDSRPSTPTNQQDIQMDDNMSPLTQLPSSPASEPTRLMEYDDADPARLFEDSNMEDATEVGDGPFSRAISPTVSELSRPTAMSIPDSSSELADDGSQEPVASISASASGIEPLRFYGHGNGRRKRKSDALDRSDSVDIIENERPKSMRVYGKKEKGKQVERTPKLKPPLLNTTVIFTLDSLGNRHPKVCSTLGEYLQLEAKDKLQLEKTSKSVGRAAAVLFQPNFSDCGLYLIHFASTFMSDPEHYFTLLTTRTLDQAERKVAWKEGDIVNMRERLQSEAQRLGEEWRAWKERKAAEEKETLKEEAAKAESSDTDVDIVETAMNPSPESGKKKGRGRGGRPRKS